MSPTIALTVTGLCGGLLFLLAAALVVAFPRVPAVRFWAASWCLAAAGCLLVWASPLLAPHFSGTWELTLRSAFVLSSEVALAFGFLAWLGESHGLAGAALIRTVLWGGSLLVLIPVALGVTKLDVVAWTLPAAWALLLVAAVVVLTARGLRQGTASTRAQTEAFLNAVLWGPAPFAVTWVVLPSFSGLGWLLGFPPFLVLGAALSFRALVHFDTRFHHHRTSGFLLEKIQDTVLFVQADGRIQALNPAFRTLLDRDEAELVGQPLSSLGADAHSRQLLAPLEALSYPDWEGPLSLRHRTGTAVPVHVVCRRIHNPAREAVGAVLLLYDLRQSRGPISSIREDELTALSNRRWVLELLEAEFQRVRRYGGELSALWVVVDHLDAVESQFGREAVDEVLRKLGAVLKGGLRKTDFCGRVGEEVFLAVLPETTMVRASLVPARLLKMFALASEGEATGAGMRLGVATLNEDDASTEEFLARLQATVE